MDTLNIVLQKIATKNATLTIRKKKEQQQKLSTL